MQSIIEFASKLIGAKAAPQEVYKFNGGVHPSEHKQESTQRPISKLAIPEKLVLPLRQHVGYVPKIKIKVGDYVLKGQMLAEAEGSVSAAIHAPTSGTITAIGEAIIPHPSGLPDMCISIQPDGKDAWTTLHPIDWRNTPKTELVASLRLSGIVGLGGATFPTHIKVRADGKSSVHTLVINAAECEPYITCDDMLMREHADEIVKGMEIVKHLLGAQHCIVGIEDNKPEATASMAKACKALADSAVKVVPTLYPSGDARRLIHLLLGTEIPHDKRSTDVGIQVFNVATVRAIYRYFNFGEPSLSRIVTMTGSVTKPQNFDVLFGTPLQNLIAAAGGANKDTTHFIMGGPMMGFDLPTTEVPITKAANCIIAATPNLFAPAPPAMPCIRCARCADACPVNLQPQELYWFAKSDNFEKARDYDLFDCIECGCCSYVCPSNIPLVQYYRYAKSEIIATDKAKEAADLARERNEFRLARIEREKLERAQKHAERAASSKKEETPETAAAETSTAPIVDDAKKAAIAAAVERAKALKQAAAQSENTSDNTLASGDSEQATIDKQAKIAAAIERAKAQKLASAQTATAETTNTKATDNSKAASEPTSAADAEQAKKDKQALIAAAIERAKAQKLAAAQAGAVPKNTENVSPAVQAEISKIDAIREKAHIVDSASNEENKSN
ncbi:MAG: electron transport complex subunit RsxC [Methylophilales bacterium 39-45-7]|jgi:electron transport complex protein RnfC|nr:MAG: electron transport complex subunit RsxC [Mehylophilales bacterium 35-46-6]OZA53577.1 MAG: electron transport complex subunit RsxC [Methylophilales bacterium 39-45-7]HQS37389.1 electron transport complex subunit RsxC [Methylotenera sp.]